MAASFGPAATPMAAPPHSMTCGTARELGVHTHTRTHHLVFAMPEGVLHGSHPMGARRATERSPTWTCIDPSLLQRPSGICTYIYVYGDHRRFRFDVRGQGCRISIAGRVTPPPAVCGFPEGLASPCYSLHSNVADFVVGRSECLTSGRREVVGDALRRMAARYPMEAQRVGRPEGEQQHVMHVLHWVFGWGGGNHDITIEAHAKHTDMMLQSHSGVRGRADEDERPEMRTASASHHRADAASINYPSAGRPDLQYGAKAAPRHMAAAAGGTPDTDREAC